MSAIVNFFTGRSKSKSRLESSKSGGKSPSTKSPGGRSQMPVVDAMLTLTPNPNPDACDPRYANPNSSP